LAFRHCIRLDLAIRPQGDVRARSFRSRRRFGSPAERASLATGRGNYKARREGGQEKGVLICYIIDKA